MNDPRDEFGPYWLQSVAPFGAEPKPVIVTPHNATDGHGASQISA